MDWPPCTDDPANNINPSLWDITMTKAQRNMKGLRTDLEVVFGLEQNRWGHYHFTTADGRTMRLKFQKQSVRLESKHGKLWHKIHTVSSGQISISSFITVLDSCEAIK